MTSRFLPLLAILLVSCRGTSTPPAHFVPDSLEALDAYLHGVVEDGAFPGAVLVVGSSHGVALTSTAGVLGLDDPSPVRDSTIYDLASLTKVVGLTTAVMLLSAEGSLDIERPVSDYLPEFGGAGHDAVTVRHLLTHTSGLPAWVPLYEETPDADSALRRIMAEPLENAPGAVYSYSDLGAITLTQVVQRVSGQSLDTYLQEHVFGPLEMRSTTFLPPASWIPRIAPTEEDPWRGRMIRGEVHDENAHHLGGVSGHAGLFSNGPDLARFAEWILDAYHDRLGDQEPRIPADLLRSFAALQPGPEDGRRGLGWAKPRQAGGSSAGELISDAAIGHTGFTGTSIWIDPAQDLYVILLTNRVHPTRENQAHIPVRREVADRACRALTKS